MGQNVSACVDGGNGEMRDTEGSGKEQKGPVKLRKAAKGSGSTHRFIKEDQFSGIARIQLTSVSTALSLSLSLSLPHLLPLPLSLSVLYIRPLDFAHQV